MRTLNELLLDNQSPIQALKSFLTNSQDLQSDLSKVTLALKMIEHGADVNTKNGKGDTLLHILFKNEEWLGLQDEKCIKNHWITKAIQNLVSRYKANLEALNAFKLTPLQYVMDSQRKFLGCKPLVLIDMGFNEDTVDAYGNSLLHLYAQTGDTQCLSFIEKLIDENQLDINQKNTHGCTPLDCFIDSGKFTKSFADSLVTLGANSDRYYPSDKTMKQFEDALANKSGQAALVMFCRIYRIIDSSNMKDSPLHRICELVKKNKQIHSVNHLYIQKLLEHEEKIISNEAEIFKVTHQDTLSNYLEEILNESINDYLKAPRLRSTSILRRICARVEKNDKISNLLIPKLLRHDNEVCEATKSFYDLNKYNYGFGGTPEQRRSTQYKTYYISFLKQCLINYFIERFSVNYANLWAISHTIQNWESVKGVLNSIYLAVQYAIKSPIANTLLKELDFKAKSEGKLPLMHAIIKSVNQSIEDKNCMTDSIQTFDVLFDTLKKVAACNRGYLKDRDTHGKDVIDYLNDLKNTFDVFYEEKSKKSDASNTIKEMIAVFTKAIQTERTFSNAIHMLFHYKSTVFDLPKDVKNEIGMTLDITV